MIIRATVVWITTKNISCYFVVIRSLGQEEAQNRCTSKCYYCCCYGFTLSTLMAVMPLNDINYFAQVYIRSLLNKLWYRNVVGLMKIQYLPYISSFTFSLHTYIFSSSFTLISCQYLVSVLLLRSSGFSILNY